MNTWLRSILWHLLSAPIIRAVGWTQDERAQFEASATFNAVYANSVSANARARGMQDLLALIHRLRSFPPEAESIDASEDVEPLPSQRGAIDGRRFGLSGGNAAIRN
jgi:hypothetical protein